jgi:hypothetical protein
MTTKAFAITGAGVAVLLTSLVPTGAAYAGKTPPSGTDTVVVQVSDATIYEGDSGTSTASFEVRRINPNSGRKSTVTYRTADGTAVAGEDYAAKTGSLTYDSKHSVFTVTVTVYGDADQEPDEYFFLDVTPTGGGDPEGRGTLLNDDGWPDS